MAVYTRHANSGCFTMFFQTALNISGIHLSKHFYVFSSLCSYLNLLGRAGTGRVVSERVTGRVGSGKIGFGTTLGNIGRMLKCGAERKHVLFIHDEQKSEMLKKGRNKT